MSEGLPELPDVRLGCRVSDFKPLGKFFPADNGFVSAQNAKYCNDSDDDETREWDC